MNATSRNQDSSQRPNRRGLLAGLLSFIVGAIPLGIGSAFFLGPLWRKRSSDTAGDEGFLPVGVAFQALPADGTPQWVTVRKDREDAWNMYPRSAVGNIWLRRVDDVALAFNSICPHLGCAVEYRSTNHDFFCPCHNSNFDLVGERLNKIPPRNLDALETKVVDGEVWVKFQNFRAGTSEKIEV